jgi:hypothetical protein
MYELCGSAPHRFVATDQDKRDERYPNSLHDFLTEHLLCDGRFIYCNPTIESSHCSERYDERPRVSIFYFSAPRQEYLINQTSPTRDSGGAGGNFLIKEWDFL